MQYYGPRACIRLSPVAVLPRYTVACRSLSRRPRSRSARCRSVAPSSAPRSNRAEWSDSAATILCCTTQFVKENNTSYYVQTVSVKEYYRYNDILCTGASNFLDLKFGGTNNFRRIKFLGNSTFEPHGFLQRRSELRQTGPEGLSTFYRYDI